MPSTDPRSQPIRPRPAGGRPAQPAAAAARPERSANSRPLLYVAGGLVLLAIPFIALGSLPVKLFAGLIVLAALQGLWRGAAEITGLVIGMLLAMLLAPTVGPALEGVIGGIAGTGGVMNRVISIAVVGLVLVVLGWGIGAVVGRKVMKGRPAWRVWDRYAGGAIGGIEGVLLALMLLWAPVAMEPIARARVEDDVALGVEPTPAAKVAVRMAEAVRESALGGVVEATNPLPESELLTLMTDFSAISRDQEALEWLLQTPVMIRLQEMPSVVDAMNRVQNAPDLAAMFADESVDPSEIAEFLNSPVSIEILDNTTVVRDVTPLAAELKAAIREARARVKTGPG